MLKNKLDFKLLNCLIIFLIILIIYNTKNLWFYLIDFIGNILKPLLISVMISYVCNLYLRRLNKRFNKYISILIFFFTFFLIIYVIFFKMFPIIINQVIDSINIIIYFLKKFSVKYNIEMMDVYSRLKDLVSVLPNINSIFNISFINGIFRYITFFCIVITCSVYLFFDWNKIRSRIKFIFIKYEKIYKYLCILNSEIEKYTCSFFILVVLNIIEYVIVFMVIGHPNYLFLGILAGVFSLIPIFGGMIINGVALVTAFVINYGLFIRTLIGILILSILDGYIVSPIVYSKGNKLHPVLIVLSIYIGNKLFGIFGVILSIPLLVIISVSLKFIKEKN